MLLSSLSLTLLSSLLSLLLLSELLVSSPSRFYRTEEVSQQQCNDVSNISEFLRNISKRMKPPKLRPWVRLPPPLSPGAWTLPTTLANEGMDFKFLLSLPSGFDFNLDLTQKKKMTSSKTPKEKTLSPSTLKKSAKKRLRNS